MNLRRPCLAVSATVLVIALAGCSGGETDSGGASAGETTTVEGIPQSWIEETREGWPDSEGFGAPMPHLQMDADCLLADSMPEVLGTEPEIQEAGWGPFGGDAEDTESYQYQCGIWAEDQYAGSLLLYVTPDSSQLRDVVDEFTGQGDTPVQENTVSTVSAAGQKLHALQRWYPTNPQGEYQVMYVEAKGADADGASEGGAARGGSSEGPVARGGADAPEPATAKSSEAGDRVPDPVDGGEAAAESQASEQPDAVSGGGEAPPPDVSNQPGSPDSSDGQFAADRVTDRSTDDRLDEILSNHGMTRDQFKETLLETVPPTDPAQLSPEQAVLRDIRAELGAPHKGDPMQKVLTPELYEKYMSGDAQGARGSVTTLADGVSMRTPEELFKGLALGYDGSPFSADADSMKVMRFTSGSDAEISWYSSMGGTGTTDGWTDPYMGNGYTKSTDPSSRSRHWLRRVKSSLVPRSGTCERTGLKSWTLSSTVRSG